MKIDFSKDALSMDPSPIRCMAKYSLDPEMISFAGGFPSERAFPLDHIKELFRRFSRELPPSILQYGSTKGNSELLDIVQGMLTERGIQADTSNVMLLGGAQRGLDLIGRILLDPGDVVLLETPSYPGALACFRNLQARMEGVRQDDRGLIISELEKKIAALKREGTPPKLLYTIPNFQNPAGTLLSAERRIAIAEIADREGIIVVEDDPYGELYFYEDDLPEISPIAATGSPSIIYLSSFSKILAPGLRTGFVCGHERIIEKIELAAQASDLCSSTLDQYIVLELCRSGKLRANMKRIRELYRHQGEAIHSYLKNYLGTAARWTRPRGGFFLWLTAQEEIDTDVLLERAIGQKVIFVPGRGFCVDGSGRNEMRLAFSKESPERMERGVKIIAGLIENYGKNESIR